MRWLPVACVVLALAPAAATAAVAPGRVIFGVGRPQPVRHVDAGGASLAVALPDGGAVLLAGAPRGVVLAQIRRDGSLDSAFGSRGIAHVAVPVERDPRRYPNTFVPLQVLRQPDGRLLIGGHGPARSLYELPQLMVVRLLPDGRLDASFGSAGIARPGFQASCGGRCEPMSLQTDGQILVTGNTGSAIPGSELQPGGPEPRFQWIVARLTGNGALDPSFGNGGIAEIGGAVGRNGGGFATGLLPDGRIVALGRGSGEPLLVRLLAMGALDPGFHGGTPVPLAVPFAFQMLVHGDGTVDVRGGAQILRFRPNGEPDAGFDGDGAVTVPGPGIAENFLPRESRGPLVFTGIKGS